MAPNPNNIIMNNQDRAGGEREALEMKMIAEIEANIFTITEGVHIHGQVRAGRACAAIATQHTTTLQGEVDKLRNALEELVEWFPELINEWRWKAGTIPKNQRDYDTVTAALDKANQALNPTPHER